MGCINILFASIYYWERGLLRGRGVDRKQLGVSRRWHVNRAWEEGSVSVTFRKIILQNLYVLHPGIIVNIHCGWYYFIPRDARVIQIMNKQSCFALSWCKTLRKIFQINSESLNTSIIIKIKFLYLNIDLFSGNTFWGIFFLFHCFPGIYLKPKSCINIK